MGFLTIVFVAISLVGVSARPDVERHANVSIIGGYNVSIEMVPYMVSLRIGDMATHWCGGSIIHEWFILTAAHCIKKNRKFKVLVGTDRINSGGQLYDIDKIHVHERYNSKTHDYDVCLIKLKKPLTFGPKVGKVYLAPTTSKLRKRALLKVTGWGSTGGDSGGPLTRGNVQVGVTSFGRHCGVYPGVYTRVTSVVSWINRKMYWY